MFSIDKKCLITVDKLSRNALNNGTCGETGIIRSLLPPLLAKQATLFPFLLPSRLCGTVLGPKIREIYRWNFPRYWKAVWQSTGSHYTWTNWFFVTTWIENCMIELKISYPKFFLLNLAYRKKAKSSIKIVIFSTKLALTICQPYRHNCLANYANDNLCIVCILKQQICNLNNNPLPKHSLGFVPTVAYCTQCWRNQSILFFFFEKKA